MATYYVGVGGSDAADGTTWANRKLTLNGAEDIPVAAGDTVYVGPGTYREMLTVDVSGTSGNPITYIGDYTGANTDGTGGVVRITGSDNDTTAARASAITATAATRSYRTFQGFSLDICSDSTINVSGSGIDSDNWTVQDCWFGSSVSGSIIVGSGAAWAIRRCAFWTGDNTSVVFSNGTTVNDRGHVVENCLFVSNRRAVSIDRVGGITVRNCDFMGPSQAVRVATALAAGQTVNVNNCVIFGCSGTALQATTTGEITEDYNTFWRNSVSRSNTATGANSVSYPPLFDGRWWFEPTLGGGTLVTPFDLASYSPLVELNSGTGAPSADLRGTTVQGTYREWGPFEYDSTLDIEAGAGGASIYRRVARILGG